RGAKIGQRPLIPPSCIVEPSQHQVNLRQTWVKLFGFGELANRSLLIGIVSRGVLRLKKGFGQARVAKRRVGRLLDDTFEKRYCLQATFGIQTCEVQGPEVIRVDRGRETGANGLVIETKRTDRVFHNGGLELEQAYIRHVRNPVVPNFSRRCVQEI